MNPHPFPGNPERYRREVYAGAISRDGVPLEFYKDRDLQAPNAPSRHISFGSGVIIPIKVIEEMGQGSVEAGLAFLTRAVANLDYGEARVGDIDPIFSHVIYPRFGGEDLYHSWVAEYQ